MEMENGSKKFGFSDLKWPRKESSAKLVDSKLEEEGSKDNATRISVNATESLRK